MSRRAIVKRGKLRRAHKAKARAAVKRALDRIADAIVSRIVGDRKIFTEYLIDTFIRR